MDRQHKLPPTLLPLSVVCFSPTYGRWKGKLLTSTLSNFPFFVKPSKEATSCCTCFSLPWNFYGKCLLRNWLRNGC